MSKWVVDIHGDIEGDYDIIKEYEEPKTAYWIDDKCSVCGKGIENLVSSNEWYRDEEPNFCPFCGLKLIEPRIDADDDNAICGRIMTREKAINMLKSKMDEICSMSFAFDRK